MVSQFYLFVHISLNASSLNNIGQVGDALIETRAFEQINKIVKPNQRVCYDLSIIHSKKP